MTKVFFMDSRVLPPLDCFLTYSVIHACKEKKSTLHFEKKNEFLCRIENNKTGCPKLQIGASAVDEFIAKKPQKMGQSSTDK